MRDFLPLDKEDLAVRVRKAALSKLNWCTKCRHCGLWDETVDHITAGCDRLNFTFHKQRHDQIAQQIHYGILRKIGAAPPELWWHHTPEEKTLHEGNVVKWDPYAYTLRKIKHNKPDMIWEREDDTLIIEIGCPLDKNVVTPEDEKTKKYGDLAEDLRRLRPGVEVKIVPIVIGNTGLVSKNAKEYLEKLEIETPLRALQKTAAMQTIRLMNMHK